MAGIDQVASRLWEIESKLTPEPERDAVPFADLMACLFPEGLPKVALEPVEHAVPVTVGPVDEVTEPEEPKVVIPEPVDKTRELLPWQIFNR